MSDREELLRLYHMRDYARRVTSFSEGRTRTDLDTDTMLEDALRYAIGIIGEAASKTPQTIRDRYPQIPWKQIIGMRNFLFHAYEQIDLDRLWDTATQNVPELLNLLEALLPPHEAG